MKSKFTFWSAIGLTYYSLAFIVVFVLFNIIGYYLKVN